MANLVENNIAPALDNHPGDVTMDRSGIDPNPAPQVESLRDKLRAHYQKGMKKPPKPNMLRGNLSPEIIDNIAVPMYLFTCIGGFYIGVFQMCPIMFADDTGQMILHQAIISLLVFQMMVNWLGIRYVDSSYTRYLGIYGPPVHDKKKVGNALLADQKPDTSSAVLMPVISETSDENRVVKNGKPQTTSRRFSLFGRDLIPAGARMRNDSVNLNEEVDEANKAMERRNSVIYKPSIDDLLSSSHSGNETRDKISTHHNNEFENASGNSKPLSKFSIEDDSATKVSTGEGVGDARMDHRFEEDQGVRRIGAALTCPTPTVTTNGEVMTKSYPYWSWVPCYDCGRARPPRCHHCPICKMCVLKRDHHCFFAGTCVGYRNHRFFCVFLVWAWAGAIYGTLYGVPYIYYFLWDDMSYLDIIFPLALLRSLLGYVPLRVPLTVAAVSFMIYFDGLAGMFIYAHSRLISWGVTSFEKLYINKSLEIKDTRGLLLKIKSIFGPYWLASFIFPIHFFTEPQEDPVLWPDIQVIKTN